MFFGRNVVDGHMQWATCKPCLFHPRIPVSCYGRVVVAYAGSDKDKVNWDDAWSRCDAVSVTNDVASIQNHVVNITKVLPE